MSDSLTSVVQELKGQAPVAPEAPVEPQAPETQTPPAASPEQPKETASALLAKLARQRKESMQATKKLSAADQEKAELLKRIQELEGKVNQKVTNPLDALKSAGFSYEDATNVVLNDNKLTPEQQIAALRKELEERDKSYEEREQKRLQEERERAEKSVQEQEEMFKTGVIEFVEQNKETYELTAREDQAEVAETVLAVIKQHFGQAMKEWEETGREGKRPKALSSKEALDLIEAHLEEKISKYYETNKIKSKFAPKPAETEQNGKQPTAPSKTLSAAATTSSASPSAKINDPVARAMAALERRGQ
jgi:hypothetical protein